jgi:hypothetical protein
MNDRHRRWFRIDNNDARRAARIISVDVSPMLS